MAEDFTNCSDFLRKPRLCRRSHAYRRSDYDDSIIFVHGTDRIVQASPRSDRKGIPSHAGASSNTLRPGYRTSLSANARLAMTVLITLGSVYAAHGVAQSQTGEVGSDQPARSRSTAATDIRSGRNPSLKTCGKRRRDSTPPEWNRIHRAKHDRQIDDDRHLSHPSRTDSGWPGLVEHRSIRLGGEGGSSIRPRRPARHV